VRGLQVLLLVVVFSIIHGPGWADVEVRPKIWSPSVHIYADGQEPFERGVSGSGPSPARVLKNPLKFHCFPDQTEPGVRCALREFAEDDPTPEERELTEGAILEAVREIGLPSLRVRIQPGEETLVNVETNFYTKPEAFRRSIDLLGYEIDLVATPASYRWFHGDGTSKATSQPGNPYPAMDVTHRYREPAQSVEPRVDVTYQVRYRVDGGAWQTLGQTIVASGPTAELAVREAAPVLTRP
jgi:hypothetical protein